MPLTDVQWILGHARLSTTQIYTTPRISDVVEHMKAHHTRLERQRQRPEPPPPALGYDAGALEILFGTGLR